MLGRKVVRMPATPVDPFGDKPAYEQVADDMTRRLASGEFPARLPSERDLSEEYLTSGKTVRHAVNVLRERGLVKTAGTRGTYNASWKP